MKNKLVYLIYSITILFGVIKTASGGYAKFQNANTNLLVIFFGSADGSIYAGEGDFDTNGVITGFWRANTVYTGETLELYIPANQQYDVQAYYMDGSGQVTYFHGSWVAATSLLRSGRDYRYFHYRGDGYMEETTQYGTEEALFEKLHPEPWDKRAYYLAIFLESFAVGAGLSVLVLTYRKAKEGLNAASSD
jgi:hypothetical protein